MRCSLFRDGVRNARESTHEWAAWVSFLGRRKRSRLEVVSANVVTNRLEARSTDKLVFFILLSTL